MHSTRGLSPQFAPQITPSEDDNKRSQDRIDATVLVRGYERVLDKHHDDDPFPSLRRPPAESMPASADRGAHPPPKTSTPEAVREDIPTAVELWWRPR